MAASKIQVVVGSLFGDEGKGSTVQWLCSEAQNKNEKPIVVCFSGGSQNGHTVYHNGVGHICSSFGSGTLLNVPTYHSEQYYVDPICVLIELQVIYDKTVSLPVSVYDDACRVITPYDVFASRADSKVRSDGTCGKGIYGTFKRHEAIPLTVGDLHRMSEAELRATLAVIAEYWKYEADADFDDNFIKAARDFVQINTVCRNIAQTSSLDDVLRNYDTVICEGSQGLLLDMDHGYAPNITPSRVGLNGLPEVLKQNAEVFFVIRSYLTRHGNGYVPKFPLDYDWSTERESNVWNEYQGTFKRGALELDLLEDAFTRHEITRDIEKYRMTPNLVITHCDTACSLSKNTKPILTADDKWIEDSCGTPNDAAEMIHTWIRTCDNIPAFKNVYWSDNWESRFNKLVFTPVIS